MSSRSFGKDLTNSSNVSTFKRIRNKLSLSKRSKKSPSEFFSVPPQSPEGVLKNANSAVTPAAPSPRSPLLNGRIAISAAVKLAHVCSRTTLRRTPLRFGQHDKEAKTQEKPVDTSRVRELKHSKKLAPFTFGNIDEHLVRPDVQLLSWMKEEPLS
jgi:hypothetical protein